MADAVKAPAKPQPIEEGTEFIRNPLGAVHDVEGTHPAVDLAKKGDGGWHFATADEISDYCKVNNLVAPSAKSHSTDGKKATAEGDALKAEEIKAADAAVRAVDSKE